MTSCVAARARRKSRGAKMMPTTIIALPSPGPRTAMKAMARRSGGKLIMTSAMKSSTRPMRLAP
jgi:hypothetical protein